MKSAAFLNHSRPDPLVDENALAEVLNLCGNTGDGLEVVSIELFASVSLLVILLNCYITHYIAWTFHNGRERLLNTAIKIVEQILFDNPVSIVNL